MNDAHLFDFNAALIVNYDDEKARADLETHGDAFRYQLVAALQLSDWAERLSDESDPIFRSMSATEIRGWVNALQAVAANIRMGLYLPGGSLFDAVIEDEGRPE